MAKTSTDTPPDAKTAALLRALSAVASLRDSSGVGPHQDFVGMLRDETDRGRALVTASFFEGKLEDLLRVRFALTRRGKKQIEPLFDGFGPLSTFSGKISLSYAFSLIGYGAQHDLHLFRKIRNEFAHSIATKNFTDIKIEQMIASFYLSEKKADPSSLQPVQLARTRFSYASGKMSALLHASCSLINEADLSMSAKEELFDDLCTRMSGVTPLSHSSLDS